MSPVVWSDTAKSTIACYRRLVYGLAARTGGGPQACRAGAARGAGTGVAIGAAVPTVGPVPNVPPALERIRRRCGIVIIVNTEDELLARAVLPRTPVIVLSLLGANL